MSGTIAKLLGSTLETFGIGPKSSRATLDASGLTVARTFSLPDRDGIASLDTLSIITDATTARTLSAGDLNAYIRMTSSSANTVTAPPGMAVGFQVHIRNAGSGTTTIAAGSGVTINKPSTLVLAASGTVTLVCVASDTYDLFGLTT